MIFPGILRCSVQLHAGSGLTIDALVEGIVGIFAFFQQFEGFLSVLAPVLSVLHGVHGRQILGSLQYELPFLMMIHACLPFQFVDKLCIGGFLVDVQLKELVRDVLVFGRVVIV